MRPRAQTEATVARIPVRKTYKLYVGGQFPRSESGRSYIVRAPDGTPLANAVRSSRKDVRDAIRTARGAVAGWSGKTAMNRGQVLYRVAELMEGRRAQFIEEVAAAEGIAPAAATAAVDRAIDRWVWYAGWADKISQILGTVNPVAAPRTSTSPSRSRPASWASSRPRPRRCSGSYRASRRPLLAAMPSSCSRPSRGRCRR